MTRKRTTLLAAVMNGGGRNTRSFLLLIVVSQFVAIIYLSGLTFYRTYHMDVEIDTIRAKHTIKVLAGLERHAAEPETDAHAPKVNLEVPAVAKDDRANDPHFPKVTLAVPPAPMVDPAKTAADAVILTPQSHESSRAASPRALRSVVIPAASPAQATSPAREATPKLPQENATVDKPKERPAIGPAIKNHPFKETYANATFSFQNKSPPEILKGWKPSPDSYKYFQPIGDEDVWMYSAYFDHQQAEFGRPLIRGFGLARKPLPRRVLCIYHDGRRERPTTKAGKFTILPEHHSSGVSAVGLECSISPEFYPEFLSVSFSWQQLAPMNRLRIQYSGPRTRNFTVCYSALHSVYNKTSELVTSIELNTLLGAEHFFVYNFSISAETDRVLRHYESKGTVTVMQWPLPTLEAWYLSQIVVIHDCIYRNRNTSQYVTLVDPDEFIIPRKHFTWGELMEDLLTNPNLTQTVPDLNYARPNRNGRKLLSVSGKSFSDTVVSADVAKTGSQYSNRHNTKSTNSVTLQAIQRTHLGTSTDRSSTSANKGAYEQLNAVTLRTLKEVKDTLNIQETSFNGSLFGSFVFRCVFFDRDVEGHWNELRRDLNISEAQADLIQRFSIEPLGTHMRTSSVFGHKKRSKMILRPERVYNVGVHFVYDHTDKTIPAYVDYTAGLLHHYRPYKEISSKTADTSAILKYKDALIERLKRTYANLSQLFPVA